jgi:hypothetical protein
MGNLHYGSPPNSFEMPDRTLAHVEYVILAKLRRNESFALTIDQADGSRERSWLSNAATLRFQFGAPATDINRAWLEELIDSANSAGGMRVSPEPSGSA